MNINSAEKEFLYRHLINYRTSSARDAITVNSILNKLSGKRKSIKKKK